MFSRNQHLHELTKTGATMRRFEMTEAQFERLAPICRAKPAITGFKQKITMFFFRVFYGSCERALRTSHSLAWQQ
jgi:hypothetical protein